jgi:hypothetical protein
MKVKQYSGSDSEIQCSDSKRTGETNVIMELGPSPIQNVETGPGLRIMGQGKTQFGWVCFILVFGCQTLITFEPF